MVVEIGSKYLASLKLIRDFVHGLRNRDYQDSIRVIEDVPAIPETDFFDNNSCKFGRCRYDRCAYKGLPSNRRILILDDSGRIAVEGHAFHSSCIECLLDDERFI